MESTFKSYENVGSLAPSELANEDGRVLRSNEISGTLPEWSNITLLIEM